MDAGLLEGSDLVESATLASGNDGTSVTHSPAWRCCLSSDKADNWKVAGVVLCEPGGSFLFGLTTDLTDHDDTVGLGVFHEFLEDVDEVGAVEGITTNTNDGRLT